MKFKVLITIALFVIVTGLYSQDNVGIGTTTPDASAILDLTSTTKGLLPPRLTTAQRNAIASPVAGLVVYNTTDTQFQFYNGSTWQSLSGISSVGLAAPSFLSVTGSPLTSNGTITLGLASQTQNLTFSSPDGAPGAPTFRALVANDIPNLNASKITSGTLIVSQGGTGAATLTGMLKGNGTSAVTAVTATAGQLTYWSDANTISGNSNLTWDNTNAILAVTGVLRHVPLGSAPGSPTKGMTYYNSTTDKLFLYDGTTWVDLGSSGGGSVPPGTDAQTLRFNGTTLEATSTLRVTSTNVAIGSAFTPASLLHTDAGNATASALKFTAGSTTGQTAGDGFEIGIDASGNGIINQKESLPIILSTTGTERIRVLSDGKVGIGSFGAPAALLHSDFGNATAHSHKFTVGSTTGLTATDGFDIGVDASGNGIVKNFENLPIIFSTNNVERMRINGTDGGLVINNSVASGTSTILNLNNTSGGGQSISMSVTNTSTGTTTGDGFKLGITADGTGEINQKENKPIYFYTNAAERMRIWENGKIGINTTTSFNDSLKLWVEGDAIINGDLVVTGNIDPKSILLVPQNTPPVSYATKGYMYFDNATNSVKVTDGTGWSDMGSRVATDLEVKNIDNIAKEVRFFEPSSSGTNYSAFKAQAQAANLNYILPNGHGLANSYLKNDASGNLSWSTIPTPGILNVTNQSSNYTVDANDDVIICTGTGGYTITLPTAAGRTGKVFHIAYRYNTSGTVTLKGNGSEKINDTNTKSINSTTSGFSVVSDGTNWIIISHTSNN